MESKIYSIVISSIILAFALIAAGISTPAFENVLGQEGAITPGGMNDTMGNESSTTSEDKSIPGQMVTNATLAFAQEGFTTEDLVNETIDLGNDTTSMNATLAFAQEDDTGMMQGEDMGDMNQSQGNDTGMVQGQSSEAKNDGNNEEEEGDDE
jgi:hypothetical protein